MIFLWLLISLSQAANTDLINLWKLDMSIRNDSPPCVLRRPVAEALTRVQSLLRLQEWGLKVSACYVPSSSNSQKDLKHSRGASLEVILVDRQGEKAKSDKKSILKKAMTQEGFTLTQGSKSQFDYRGWESFEISDLPLSKFP